MIEVCRNILLNIVNNKQFCFMVVEPKLKYFFSISKLESFLSAFSTPSAIASLHSTQASRFETILTKNPNRSFIDQLQII